jgi:secretion/DNA translocation related TadE-like protein
MTRPADDDRGMATLWTAYAIAGIAALTAVLMAMAAVSVARHRVEAAADLAALAGAAYGVWGAEHACAQARWVADRMAVSLDECRSEGWTVVVRVNTSVGGLGNLNAQARAGPVTGDGRSMTAE